MVSCSTDESSALALTHPECFKFHSVYNSTKGNTSEKYTFPKKITYRLYGIALKSNYEIGNDSLAPTIE